MLASRKSLQPAELTLHAKHAETLRLDRRVERGGDRQAEYAAGVGGVDDAVVPQPRTGVIRVTLSLVLLADRRFEGFFLLGRPGLAGGFDAVTLDGGQHA